MKTHSDSFLRARYEIDRKICGIFDLNDVIKSLIDTCCKLLEVEACSIILLNEMTGNLKFHFVKGAKQKELTGFSMERGKGIVGWVIDNKKPIIVNNPKKDDRFFSGVDETTGFETRNIFAVPLKYNSGILGAIEFINKKNGKSFSEKEDSFLIEIAEHISYILYNRRSFLQQNDEKRLAIIGTMSSMIVHEIHNPLSIIRGYTELVLKKNCNEDEQKLYLTKIISEVDRLNNLTNEILGLARDSRKNLKKCNINKVIEEAADFYKKELHENTIELKLSLDKKIPEIQAAQDALYQVFINLIKNAADALQGNEKKRKIEISTHCLEDSMKIEIRNNGPEIASNKIDSIFDPFVTSKKKGSGLGLTIVKKIIKEHNGSIDVLSNPDFTEFLIVIPFTND